MADRDEGTATAELAVAMPALVLALAAVLSVGQAVLAQVGCVDAARAGARAAARGESPAAVLDLARDGVPDAVVSVRQEGTQVSVSVARRMTLLLPHGPALQLRARAVAQAEARAAADRGSAAVLLLGVCLLAVVLAVGVGAVGAAVVARHRAQAAADLGALAAADVAIGRHPGVPCIAAAQVARANGAALEQCVVFGDDVAVRAVVRPLGAAARLGVAAASARAGPGPARSPGTLR